MSLRAVSETLDRTIPNRTAKLVAIALADHHNQSTGRCFPAVETLMKQADASRATVFRALTWLEEKGYIRREQRYDDHSYGRQMTSDYILLYLEPGWGSQNETPRNQPFSNDEKAKRLKTGGLTGETGEGLTRETGEGLNRETPINGKKEQEERTGKKRNITARSAPGGGVDGVPPLPKKTRPGPKQGRLLESVSPPSPERECFEEFRTVARECGFVEPKVLTPSREACLRQVLATYGRESWQQALTNARNSTFLKGHNDVGWVMSLDDMLKEKIYLRLLEGGFVGKPTLVASREQGYAKNGAYKGKTI